MDQPNALIESQRRKVAAADRAVMVAQQTAERERLILTGMEVMERAFAADSSPQAEGGTKNPDVASARAHSAASSGPGRQRGAISHEWRAVLARVGRAAFTDADFHHYAQEVVGRDIRPADAKRRRESYQSNHLVEEAGDGFRYRITDYAFEKFGLASLNENGAAEAAPDAEEVGASSDQEPNTDEVLG